MLCRLFVLAVASNKIHSSNLHASFYNPSPQIKQEEHMAGVESIINEASLFENPDEVKTQQQFREENIKEANRMAQHDF